MALNEFGIYQGADVWNDGIPPIVPTSSTPIEPIDGSYGVWLRSSGTVISSAMNMPTVSLGVGHRIDVYNKGTVDTLQWYAGGSPYIHNGGTVSDMVLSQTGTNKDTLTIEHGGYVVSLGVKGAQSRTITGGGSLGTLTVQSAPISGNSITVGSLTQSSYGRLEAFEATTVMSADIYANHFRIYSGAVASAVTVYAGGNMSVGSGGSALNVVNSGGNIVVADGGYIEYA